MTGDRSFFFSSVDAPPSRQPEPDVTSLLVRSFTAPPWKDGFSPDWARKTLQAVYDSAFFFGVFARCKDARLAGFALASDESYDGQQVSLALHFLCVDPVFQRRGVGGALLQKVIEEAHVRGKRFVELVSAGKGPAKALYVQKGFVSPTDPRVNPSGHLLRHYL